MHMPKYIRTQECMDILYFLLIGKPVPHDKREDIHLYNIYVIFF